MESKSEYVPGTPEKTRVDKWLWATRLFKSRSIAADNCDKGKIKIAGQAVKASRIIKAGDIITIRNGAFTSQYEVLQLTENRLPTKSVADFCKDITPKEEKERMEIHSIQTNVYRNRGEGRPTKRDRRELERGMEWGGSED